MHQQAHQEKVLKWLKPPLTATSTTKWALQLFLKTANFSLFLNVPNISLHKSFFFVVFSLLLFTACSSNEKETPEGIIAPDKLTEILTEMQLSEGILIHLNQTRGEAHTYKQDLYNKVFEKHAISKQQLDSSISYYATKDIKTLDKVYADVITNLSQKQSEIRAE